MNYDVCRTNIEQTEREIKMNDNNLGNRIADLLKQRGMTQRELAVKAGITEKSMAGIVNGERTPMGPTVANIANALHTTPGYLLGKEEKKEEEMTGLTTKEQERKAIQKIRKIVNDLGETSYVGFAMEGVLEIAEENIENDAAFSLKRQLELAETREKERDIQNKALKEEIADLEVVIKKHVESERALQLKIQNMERESALFPEDLAQELYCIVTEEKRKAQLEMENAIDNMLEKVIAKEDGSEEAGEYLGWKEKRDNYKKIIDSLDRQERKRAGRE